MINLDESATHTQDTLAALADQLRSTPGAAVIISEHLALPDDALADLVADGPGGSQVFTITAAHGVPVRVLHHRIVDVATDVHPAATANSRAVGLIRLAQQDVPRAVTALEDAHRAIPADTPADQSFAWVLLVLTRSGIPLKAEPLAPWPYSVDGVAPTLAPGQAAAMRLQRANRADDGIYSVAVLRRLSKPLSALGAARGWSPNAITLVSLAIGIAAAASFAVGQRWAMVLGAVLLQVSIVVDCSDGEVARLTGRFSTVGAWLDASTDRIKEYLVYGALAAGAVRMGVAEGPAIWWLAGATMVWQTGRHLSDYTFHQVQVARETVNVTRPLSDTTQQQDNYGGIVAAATRANSRPGLRSVKKLIFFPIGERWLLISLTAALLNPWWTFGGLLAAGVLSAAYAFAGRILRTRSWPRVGMGSDVVAPQVDAGPLAAAVSRLPALSGPGVFAGGTVVWVLGIIGLVIAACRTAAGADDPNLLRLGAAALLLIAGVAVPPAALGVAGFRFGWAVPSLLAVLELSTWLAATAALAPEMAPWGFAVAGVVAYHRYDLLYRAMAARPAPDWVRAIGGGTDGRLIIVAIGVAAGPAVWSAALPGFTILLACTTMGVASAQWLRETSEPRA